MGFDAIHGGAVAAAAAAAAATARNPSNVKPGLLELAYKWGARSKVGGKEKEL